MVRTRVGTLRHVGIILKCSPLISDSGDVKGDEVKRELTKINNLNEKNKLNNLNNTFQQISKLLTNLEAKNQLVMKGFILDFE